jgi:hypothetical protein
MQPMILQERNRPGKAVRADAALLFHVLGMRGFSG